tara:strand:- start:5061 stop:5288 length:228 start_codon:yes stop_codon:yes gene_type:complete
MGIATDLTNGKIVERLSNLFLSNANIVVGSSQSEVSRIWTDNVAGAPLTHHEMKKVYRLYEYTGELTLVGNALGN